MQCKCGFKNVAAAKFCGSCGQALGGESAAGSTAPKVAVSSTSSTASPVLPAADRTVARGRSRAGIAIVAAVAVIATAGYWWLNRPPGQYKLDNGGLYPINVSGKYGFMDRSGKIVITPQFDETYGFSEGLAAVRIGTKFGYISTKGVVAITPQFDDVSSFRYGRATVKLCCGLWYQSNANNRFGVIDDDGKYISSPNLRWVGRWFSGDFLSVQTTDGKVAFLNRSGKVAISGDFNQLPGGGGFAAGLAPAATGGKWGYIETTGKWAIDPQFDQAEKFSDGLAGVRVGGRIGYIDRKGKFVVNPQYDFAVEDFFGGYARVWSNGKVGFINARGEVVVEPKYLFAADFSDGFAPVKTDAGWGYIDPAGKMAVSPQFDSADQFQNGLAHVTALGKEAYVTTTGAFVVDPFPGTTVVAEKARIASEAAQAAAKAKEAEQVAAQAKEAEQAQVARAIERQDAELRQNISSARNILVGSWKDENSLSTYRSDGTIATRWDNGDERTGEWRVDGDSIIHTYSRVKSPNGQWRSQAVTSNSKLVYIDDNIFRVTQGGTTWNNHRVSRN